MYIPMKRWVLHVSRSSSFMRIFLNALDSTNVTLLFQVWNHTQQSFPHLNKNEIARRIHSSSDFYFRLSTKIYFLFLVLPFYGGVSLSGFCRQCHGHAQLLAF